MQKDQKACFFFSDEQVNALRHEHQLMQHRTTRARLEAATVRAQDVAKSTCGNGQIIENALDEYGCDMLWFNMLD